MRNTTSTTDEFRFRRAAFYSQLKAKVGNILEASPSLSFRTLPSGPLNTFDRNIFETLPPRIMYLSPT
jgi:hypothetical protein